MVKSNRMDKIKKPPSPWVIPGIILPNIPLLMTPIIFKDLVIDQIFIRYKISIEMLRSRQKSTEVVYCRQLLCFLLRESYGNKTTYVWIANLLDTDHSTILKSIKVFKDRLEVNDKLQKKVKDHIVGQTFPTIREDYNHFKLILYKCLRPNLISLVSPDILEVEKTLSQNS